MTVASVKEVGEQAMPGGVSIRCRWFVGNVQKEGGPYHPDSLVLAPADGGVLMGFV